MFIFNSKFIDMKTLIKRIVETREKSDRKVGDQTDFLLSTPANATRLSESINQDKLGKVIKNGSHFRSKSSHSLM